jgi:hypothetical protein
MSEFNLEHWPLMLLIAAGIAGGIAAGWCIKCSVRYLQEKIACKALDRMIMVRIWVSEQIEGHLFDSYAQLDAMLRMLDTEDEAPLIRLIDDVKARLNRADLVVLAMRDGRIASRIDPDGKRVFEIRKERAL